MEPIPYLRRDEANFPHALRLTPDPPAGLYYRVEERCAIDSLFRKPLIAVVGTRKMTPYGAAVIAELVPALVRAGCVIVSGLAYGCDGAAHTAALDSGGLTIAVLGGGVSDMDIYPRGHVQLAKRILENSGALLGEFPAGTTTYKSHFPHRNRIIAGLCGATIVVEGELQSGSLITGKLAAEFGREVFAVPGPIHAPYSTGTNYLIQNGAHLYTGPQDVLSVLDIRPDTTICPVAAPQLSPDLLHIYQALQVPLDFDGLLVATRYSSIDLMTYLTQLELLGMISKVGSSWIRTSI